MVVVGNQAREDSQDGELGINDQQLGNQAVEEEQPEEAEEEEEPQGNSEKKNPEEDGVQDDQRVEEEAGAQESSGIAGMGPCSPDLKERVKQLKKQLADLVAVPCATRLLPILIGSGGTLSPPWSEQPKTWTPQPMPTNMHTACYLPTGQEE
jgi:hypothetical protein